MLYYLTSLFCQLHDVLKTFLTSSYLTLHIITLHIVGCSSDIFAFNKGDINNQLFRPPDTIVSVNYRYLLGESPPPRIRKSPRKISKSNNFIITTLIHHHPPQNAESGIHIAVQCTIYTALKSHYLICSVCPNSCRCFVSLKKKNTEIAADEKHT